jgi:hypothetical protein
VDQLESTTPGLVAQMKGKPTKHRYCYATIFVDHFSDLTYIFLHKQITSEETIDAKRAFEAYSREKGVNILHYHADNGRFADNAFLKHVKDSGQTISFCGVNAHFQNGIAEKRIRDIQEQARTSLLHAKHRWPGAVEVHLWPYAMRHSVDIRNATLQKGKDRTPIELFACLAVRPKIRHFHPFACPVYVLRNELQGGQSLPKWESRSRLGLYIGPSPRHARSVALILNLQTGMVSPQYHVKFDDWFETLKDQATIKSEWQSLCHFRLDPKKKSWFPWIGKADHTKVTGSTINESPAQPEGQPDIPPDAQLEHQAAADSSGGE